MSDEYFLSPKYQMRSLNLLIFATLFLGNLSLSSVKAQTVNIHLVAQTRPNLPPPENLPRPQLPQPTPLETPTLPPPEDLFQTPREITPTPEIAPRNVQGPIRVTRFEVIGSTVFSPEELAKATQEFTGKPITFAELLRASDVVKKLYTDKGYISSGAFIPADQTFKTRGGVIKIQVIEGSVESIKVRGLKRLNPNYIHGRLSVITSPPFNVNRLLEGMRQLQLNPLIESLNAELSAGSRPGSSFLDIKITEHSFVPQNRFEQSTSSLLNSSIVATGRGGLPPSPTDLLTNDAVLIDTPNLNQSSSSFLQRSKVLYDARRFIEAVQVLQQAAQEYRQKGDQLRLATTLSNLSLAYQQLGAFTEAQQAITESLKLLEDRQNLQIFAQTLEIQGSLQLIMGRTQAALASWQHAEEIYQKAKNYGGVVRAQINQAQAWRTQGFYRRAVQMLEAVQQQLQPQPDSVEKAVALRSLGDALVISGSLQQSQEVLEKSLVIAQRIESSTAIAASFVSLGNNARKNQQTPTAISYYQKAIQLAPSPLAKIQAQLNYFSLLIEEQKLTESQTVLPAIQSQLGQLPSSRAAIYAQINFAQSLTKLRIESQSTIANFQKIAQILANAIIESRKLSDQRAEAYALLSLGNLYEQTQQWSDAQSLTEQGLILSQAISTPEISYRLQWQLGRLLWKQKQFQGAIAAYDAALYSLQFIRNDLVALNQDVQFNFRDSIEPIYRQSVELLLQFSLERPNEKILDRARLRVEASKFAELENFFQGDCCGISKPYIILDQLVDQDNPNTAIFYLIILPQELQVVVKVPNRPLQSFSTQISQTEVETYIAELQKNLVNPSATKVTQIQLQKVYNWLIQPIKSQLEAQGVNNLIFVGDVPLINIPMAALYDGKQYLVENYSITYIPALYLYPYGQHYLPKSKLRVLLAGLTEQIQEFSDFSPLPAVKDELYKIASIIPSKILLNQNFTSLNLKKLLSSMEFSVLHLATHGQFSSRAESNFVLASDGPIHVNQFNNLLSSNNSKPPSRLELLVLSASETARGDKRAILGLAGVALRSGASSTLASLWAIDDKATEILMTRFYREWINTEATKAEALRRAQESLLHDPRYNSPAFWAPFVLIGDWR